MKEQSGKVRDDEVEEEGSQPVQAGFFVGAEGVFVFGGRVGRRRAGFARERGQIERRE
ncbi:MAG: hypothetical protein LC776_13900 [Acidobacteria bacterium]|nr:hypothetical protein [Acidobacteriota bacterium]